MRWWVVVLVIALAPAVVYWELPRIAAFQEAPGAGLMIRKLTTTRSTANGVPTLEINGEIVNGSRVTRNVPKVRVSLRDSQDHELRSWIVPSADSRLDAQGVSTFHFSVNRPPAEAVSAMLEFVRDSD